VAVGTPGELRALAPGREKVIVDENALPRDRLEGLGTLKLYAGKWAVFPRADEAMRRLLDLCLQARIEAAVSPATLEDVFIHLVDDHQPLRLGELR